MDSHTPSELHTEWLFPLNGSSPPLHCMLTVVPGVRASVSLLEMTNLPIVVSKEGHTATVGVIEMYNV